ncbi:hypothetical protein BJX65DRAFT_308179 [Aspergillus insuetus]
METTGHSNSTDLVHGHGHHHLPDLDGTKTSDEVIILILGAIVFLTFALGLAFQLCDNPVWFLRRKQLAWEEDEYEDQDNDFGQIHQMAEFDVEAAAATAAQTLSGITEPLLKPGSSHQLQLHPFRGATRYGTITQHHVEAGGVRKMVLVVEGGLVGEGPSTVQDGYTEWFEAWRERNGIKAGVEATERAFDEEDLTDEGTSFATAAVNETSAVDESPPLLEFDLDEDQDEDQDERSDSYHTACM